MRKPIAMETHLRSGGTRWTFDNGAHIELPPEPFDAKESVRMVVCALVWVISLPGRLVVTAFLTPFLILATPLWLLLDAYQWACKGREWDCVALVVAKGLYWRFLIVGDLTGWLDL